MLKKNTLVVGPFQCNCSILVCDVTKEAVLIDAGDEGTRIATWLEKAGVCVKYSIHTHGHLDHIGAVSELKEKFPAIKILLHNGDQWLYENLQMQGQLFGIQYKKPPAIDYFVQDEEVLSFGENHKFSILHTPGHSPGGICLCFKEKTLGTEPVVFTGDTLFQSSIGRTDLWGADHKMLIRSIKERLLVLDEQTKVYPGHGMSTHIGIERKENPFL